MNVSFYTLGCNVNKYETQKMRQLFLENGDQIIENGAADVIIINSCAVTSSADKSSVQLLKRLRKNNPQAVIALVGCYGELLRQNGKTELADADILIGNDKLDIVKHINKLRKKPKSNPTKPTASSGAPIPRVYLQVQNGCNNSCSYCIVPSLRGKSTSKPFNEIKDELRELISQGHKEIVLAGMNLSFYNDMDYTLIDILEEANSADGLELISLSSLEPGIMTDRFIEKLPDITKLSPHFHISLQSGCNKTLSKMNRNYTFEEYFSIITKLRSAISGAEITTDIIAGFPGESDEDFLLSCNNIAKCRFDDIHIFKFSRREGTSAALMPEQVTEHKKTIRAAILQGIKIQTRYNVLFK